MEKIETNYYRKEMKDIYDLKNYLDPMLKYKIN